VVQLSPTGVSYVAAVYTNVAPANRNMLLHGIHLHREMLLKHLLLHCLLLHLLLFCIDSIASILLLWLSPPEIRELPISIEFAILTIALEIEPLS